MRLYSDVRPLLVGSVLLFACTQGPATPSSIPSRTPPVVVVASASPSLADCERASLQAAADFVGRFNARDLPGLTSLFTVDAATYWLRRGDALSDGFKEGGREMIGRMLQVRMADGEALAYDRVDPDPSPAVHYTDQGTGQLFLVPRFVGLRGTFPDGGVRPLGTKFVYACGQRGIVQLLILSSA